MADSAARGWVKAVKFAPPPTHTLLALGPFAINVSDKVMPFPNYVGILGPDAGERCKLFINYQFNVILLTKWEQL